MDRTEPVGGAPQALSAADQAVAAEARRQLAICNICNYCNGLCAVFDAAERRAALGDGDLDHLANLCHHCRSCLYDCQYAPPHAFAVNLPRALARQRWASYRRYAWPPALALLFRCGGRGTGFIAVGLVLAVTLAVLLAVPPPVLFAAHSGAGAFYRVLPWWLMVALGGLGFGFGLLAVGVSTRRYWRATAPGKADAPRLSERQDAVARTGAWRRALLDLLLLVNQRGGGPGCADIDHRPSRLRRRLHHALFYGFLLCFAATLAATGYHHLLGREAPYPLLSAPVLLGSLGGIGMVVGAAGLLRLRRQEDPTPTEPDSRGADAAALWLLLAVAGSGLVLLGLRGSTAMGLLLALHLGTVLALFLLFPYGKLVHGAYRGAALLRNAIERETGQ